MAIDVTGEWWTGETADDIGDYLEELAPEGFPVHHVVRSTCTACSGGVFVIELDPSSVCTRRTCVRCGLVAYMLDSHEYWMDGDEEDGPEAVTCPCGAGHFESSVGFHFSDDQEVRWVSIGLRCVRDGVLGCCTAWRIRSAPSRHLLNLA